MVQGMHKVETKLMSASVQLWLFHVVRKITQIEPPTEESHCPCATACHGDNTNCLSGEGIQSLPGLRGRMEVLLCLPQNHKLHTRVRKGCPVELRVVTMEKPDTSSVHQDKNQPTTAKNTRNAAGVLTMSSFCYVWFQVIFTKITICDRVGEFIIN